MPLLRVLDFRGWLLMGTAACCVALAGVLATLGSSAQAGGTLEERKLPMKFDWVACEPNCRGWVSAVGIITGDTPKEFDDFARSRQLGGATVVLDSSGGSVNDAIALGRRFRNLGLLTTVGISTQQRGAQNARPAVASNAYCESMCVFLLLAGKKRYVPDGAHVRVHQIWMGDRADDARAASYSAQDLMIVERDIGRLAKYTFDMGGAGDLLSLALNVPPWEDLHELDAAELKLTNLSNAESIGDVLPHVNIAGPALVDLAPRKQVTKDLVAKDLVGKDLLGKDLAAKEPLQKDLGPKVQDRFMADTAQPSRSTKTAEALGPIGNSSGPQE